MEMKEILLTPEELKALKMWFAYDVPNRIMKENKMFGHIPTDYNTYPEQEQPYRSAIAKIIHA